jgi:hypothetical protein
VKMMSELACMEARIIAADPHGPFPEQGKMIRCFLRDGQVIDGTACRIWLDLDTVRIDVIPSACGGTEAWRFNRSCFFHVTPAEGDSWTAL